MITALTLPDALAGVVVTALFLLPGLAMGIAVSRRLRWGLAAALVGAFGVSSATASAVMVVGGGLGWSLEAGIAAFAAVAVGLSVASFFVGRKQPRLRLDLPGLALMALAAVTAVVERPWFKISADAFYHLAAARSLLARHALVVTDPFHGTSITTADPSSGVLHTMLAMAGRIVPLDMTQLWIGLNVLGAILIVASFYALARRLAGVDWAAMIATEGYVVANLFVDFRASSYPNRISLVLLFFGLLCLTEVLDRPTWTAAGMALVAGVGISAMHVGNAEFYFLAGATIALWALADALIARRREGRFTFEGFGAVAAVLIGGLVLALPLLLPKFGMVSSSAMVDTTAAVTRVDLFQMGPFVVTRPGRFFDGGNLPFVLTTALALFMAGWSFVRRDRVGLAAFALCSLPLMLLFDPPLTTLAVNSSFYNLVRISALLGFTTYLAIAWALARPRGVPGSSQAVFLAVLALAASLLISVQYLQTTFTERVGAVRKGANVSVWRSRQLDIRGNWTYSMVDRISKRVGDDYPVVAALPDTGYYLSGLVPIRLVAAPRGHSPLGVEQKDGPKRRQDMQWLLYSTTSIDRRWEILKRWDVDYVFLWRSRLAEQGGARSMLEQSQLFEPVEESSRLLLLKVNRSFEPTPTKSAGE